MMEENNKSNLKLIFKTPVRIRYQRIEPVEPDYQILRANLVRRIRSIFLYTGSRPIEAANEPRDAGKQWNASWQEVRSYRWSSRQKQRIAVNGYMGELQVGSVADDELQWWRLGELLGIGKMASFGLGSYQISEI